MGEKNTKKNKPAKPKRDSDLNFKLGVGLLFAVLLAFAAINVLTTDNEESVKLKKAKRISQKLREEPFANEEEDDIWDILMLVQQWPETFCKIKFYKPNRINCRYPNDKDLWTIHGMWPTKRGTKGPNDCAINHRFDVGQVTTIRGDLNYYWPNLIASASNENFWSYEWRKHGTCALDHEELDSQFKYFQRALEIAKSKNMKDVLGASGIVPSLQTGFSYSDILNAVGRRHRGRPDLQCHYDSSTGRHFLQEIRICFDRSNNEIDCDKIGNCPHGKDIFYPPAESTF